MKVLNDKHLDNIQTLSLSMDKNSIQIALKTKKICKTYNNNNNSVIVAVAIKIKCSSSNRYVPILAYRLRGETYACASLPGSSDWGTKC